MIIRFSKVREGVTTPTRSNPSDAGLDVYFCPEQESANWRMQPGDSKIFPTGLKFEVPHGYMLEVKNRSGMAAMRSLVVGACVVDSGYEGEVFINLHNIGSSTEHVKNGTKIAQLVLTPVIHFRPQETASEALYNEYPMTISDRGDGALGSTDG
jgi:dUTP pyrophosphatase